MRGARHSSTVAGRQYRARLSAFAAPAERLNLDADTGAHVAEGEHGAVAAVGRCVEAHGDLSVAGWVLARPEEEVPAREVSVVVRVHVVRVMDEVRFRPLDEV